MNGTVTLLMQLIRECIDDDFRADIDDSDLAGERLSDVYRLASKHDLGHFVIAALEARHLIGNDEKGYAQRQPLVMAAYRHERQMFELQRVSGVLESAHIPHIFLKGSELCNEYPQPFLRTRSDIDVLVEPQNIDAAREAIVDALGYTVRHTSSHDVSMLSDSRVHVELHYTLWDEEISHGIGKSAADVLERVWDSARALDGNTYRLTMDGALFCFYHYVHMAKHVLNGGCGIKPFVDIKILKKRNDECRAGLEVLALEGRIDKFVGVADRLTEVWFGDARHDDATLCLEEYVLGGGVYGADESRIAVAQSKNCGKVGFVLSRIFIPWHELRVRYPVLNKHKWLTPFCAVARWCELVFGKKKDVTARTLRNNAAISDERARKTREMIKKIGL